MFPKLRVVVLVLMSIGLYSGVAKAMGFIAPKQEIVKIARQLSYRDFPKTSHILTIARIESGFNPLAVNAMSRGIMQVNYAPLDVEENMRRGVKILREYYLITKSIEGAVKAYNIGIGNYLNGHLEASGEDYWGKFSGQLGFYRKYDLFGNGICSTCPSANTLSRFAQGANPLQHLYEVPSFYRKAIFDF